MKDKKQKGVYVIPKNEFGITLGIPSGIPLICLPSGGTAPYTYFWDFAQQVSPQPTNYGAGTLSILPQTFSGGGATAVTQQVFLTQPNASEILDCVVRCRVTDAKLRVTYAYYRVFATGNPV